MHTTPQLTRRNEFEALLHDYHMSQRALGVLAKTPLVTLLGPSGTGRNTIIRELVKTGYYHFIVSDTTRPPRYNDGVLEQNGVEYFFRTEDEMLEDIRAGEFVEAEVIHGQQVSGTSIREIERANKENKITIADLDLLGAITMAHLKPDAISIVLLPPSFEEWLRRMQNRTSVTDAELRNRLETAVKILTTVLQEEFFIFVINDDLQTTVQTIDEIARLQTSASAAQQHARELAQQLLHHTQAYLAQAKPNSNNA